MASVMSSFDPPRPQSHHGIHASPHESPRIPRPASQASLHLPINGYGTASPHENQPMTAFPGNNPPPYKSYQQPPGLSLPLPNQHYMGGYPSSATLFPNSAPIYDARSSSMWRTVSQAHPMNSASDQSMTSRYTASPHSATPHLLHDSPPTASLPGGQPTPTIHMSEDNRHINPALFNPTYPSFGNSMSRSTSGASDMGHDTSRLLTPHYDGFSPAESELRKVSDSLGRNRAYATYGGGFDFQGPTVSLEPHPQPEGLYFSRGYAGDHYAMSAERGESKPDLGLLVNDTDYERERQANIINNRKLLDDVGLGGAHGYTRARDVSTGGRNRKASTPLRKRLPSEVPVRSSSRIASFNRNVSYAELDGGVDESTDESDGEDAYAPMMEEDEFRPSKRSKGGMRLSYSQYAPARKSTQKPEMSLYGLLQVYPDIPHRFPLFYYTLNNDLTINSDSVPLIGSIPSTCTPLEKADTLKGYFHRGRRVLAQLDAFTGRCDRKYDGPEERWAELDFHTRIAVRDVRRKVVERCENYKYTRRDILDKMVGKGKWQPIEAGMVEWHVDMHPNNDPANDLANVTLTMPTPPPNFYASQQSQQAQAMQGQQQQGQGQQQRLGSYPANMGSTRMIRPFPARRPMSANPRIMSVNMASPGDYTAGTGAGAGGAGAGMPYAYPHTAPPVQHQPSMYGEDQVPMTVQMPPPSAGSTAGPGVPVVSVAGSAAASDPMHSAGSATASATASASATLAPHWEGYERASSASTPLPSIVSGPDMRGEKRARSDEGDDDRQADSLQWGDGPYAS